MPLPKGSYKETTLAPSRPVELHLGPQVGQVSKHVTGAVQRSWGWPE